MQRYFLKKFFYSRHILFVWFGQSEKQYFSLLFNAGTLQRTCTLNNVKLPVRMASSYTGKFNPASPKIYRASPFVPKQLKLSRLVRFPMPHS